MNCSSVTSNVAGAFEQIVRHDSMSLRMACSRSAVSMRSQSSRKAMTRASSPLRPAARNNGNPTSRDVAPVIRAT